jgi:predicted metal-dependent phosphoesterase TrpH
MISQGNTVVVELTFTGTHKEAPNKKIEIPFVEIFDFEAGKVKLHKEYARAQERTP